MATGILDSSSKNLSMLDKRFEERKNSVDRVHERFYNLRMDRQAQINAFNQKIAQANAQTSLASFFQQQQLINKRAADIEAARAAYQQHYEQYGGTLNESALRFLDQHAKIDVPTFTSIMAGYEHAKASAEQRDRERIEAQVAMAEKSGALEKERAALLEKALQAELAPRIQALENEKALLAAQQDENDKYRKQLDALYDKRFDAETKMLLAGMRGSGTGRGAVSGSAAAFNAANKQGSGDDFAKRIAEAYGPNSGYMEAEIPEFSRFIQNHPMYDAYTRTPTNQIVINYLTDYENGLAYKSLEKTDKELYDALEKKKKEYIKENSATRDISLEDRATAQNLQTQGDPAFSDKDFQGKHLGIGTSENYLGKLFEAAVDSMLLAGYSKEVSAFARSNKNIDTQSSDFGVINIANKLDAIARAKNPSIGKSGKLTDEEVKNLLPANNMNIAAAIADRQIRPVFNIKALTNEKLYEDIMYSKTPEEFGNNWAKAFPDNKNNPNYVTIKGYNERAAENNRKYRASQEYNKLIKEGDEIGAENVMRRFFGMPEKVPQTQAQAQVQAQAQAQALTPNQQVIFNAVNSAIQRTGADPNIADTMMRMAAVESAYKTDVRNAAGSSALGAFQITDSKWDTLRSRYPQFGLTSDGRTNPEQAAIGTALLIKEHQDAFGRNGIEATPGNIYLGHFLGTGGALSFLNAYNTNPNQGAASVIRNTKGLGEEAVKKNSGVLFDNGRERSVAEIKDWADRKMGAGQQPVIQQQQSQNNPFYSDNPFQY